MKKVLWIVSGAIQASMVPSLIAWAKSAFPEIRFEVGTTVGSAMFVSSVTLAEVSGHPIREDVWSATSGMVTTHHLDVAEKFDGLLVWPMSMDFCSQLAYCRGEGPLSLGVNVTKVPVVVFPVFPPGAFSNPLAVELLKRLEQRSNLLVVRPTGEGTSLRSGQPLSGGGIDPSVVLRTLISAMEDEDA